MKKNHSVIFKLFNFYIAAVLMLLAFTACSERDDTPEEFPDWKNKNEIFFEAAYLAKDYDFTVKRYSLSEKVATTNTDYVLVEVFGSDEEADMETPFLNDTVLIHYVGYLLPSTTYKTGYEFDKSYIDPFDYETAVPSKLAVNDLVVGVSSVLQEMHRGDYWRVTIPYQMGYGTAGNGNVPGYSTLIFEIRLEDFWTKKKGDR
jgi:FKBP-type peptidyl-prolyl cis-trans isomerase FklB